MLLIQVVSRMSKVDIKIKYDLTFNPFHTNEGLSPWVVIGTPHQTGSKRTKFSPRAILPVAFGLPVGPDVSYMYTNTYKLYTA